ncbi:MAG: hypothetical protein NZR01_06950 [Bryobacteraceae bacterium]|nr:hypothetical protein [Bryobacteraceae bacterium]
MKRLWLAFGAVTAISFAILGWIGTRIYQEKPPIPDRVVTRDGTTVIGPGEIPAGQNIWQSMGGMEVGSVWGHGSYVAQDWTADWLRRELEFVLEEWSRAGHGRTFRELDEEQKGALRARLEKMFRTNTYDAATNTIVIDGVRGRAFEANAAYYAKLFAEGQPAYAIPRGAVPDAERARKLAAFFWWTAWSASTIPAGRYDHVHAQLAARAAGGKPADGRERDVDGRKHPDAAGRHLRDGVVVRVAGQGDAAGAPGGGSAAEAGADAVPAGDAQVLLGGRAADSGADCSGRGDGSLRG